MMQSSFSRAEASALLNLINKELDRLKDLFDALKKENKLEEARDKAKEYDTFNDLYSIILCSEKRSTPSEISNHVRFRLIDAL